MPTKPTEVFRDKSYSFFKLPLELRTEVYIQLTVDSCEWPPIDHHTSASVQSSIVLRKPSSGQMLRTCSVVYEKFLPVLYGSQTSAVFNGTSLHDGLMSIGGLAQKHLRCLRLSYHESLEINSSFRPLDLYTRIERGAWFEKSAVLPKLHSLKQVQLRCEVFWTKHYLYGRIFDIFVCDRCPHKKFLESLDDTKVKPSHGLLDSMDVVSQRGNVEWLLDLNSCQRGGNDAGEGWTRDCVIVKIMAGEDGAQRWSIRRL